MVVVVVMTVSTDKGKRRITDCDRQLDLAPLFLSNDDVAQAEMTAHGDSIVFTGNRSKTLWCFA